MLKTSYFSAFALILSATAIVSCGKKTQTAAGKTSITVAAVNNPLFIDIQGLLPEFNKLYPDIDVNILYFPEDQLHTEQQQAATTKTGTYDVFTVGQYEAPIFGKNGWTVSLSPYIAATDPNYDAGDFLPGLVAGLKDQNDLVAVPFYGESGMIMYRKDYLQNAGAGALPLNPNWTQVAAAARAVHNPNNGISGICLRGQPGWGEILEPFDTVVNAFGGDVFDTAWDAQITGQGFTDATNFYVNLLHDAGVANASAYGFTECLAAYNAGKVAIWYDATVGASSFVGDAATNSGYSYAPIQNPNLQYPGWLWSWSMAVSSDSKQKDAAWKFVAWATSKDYIQLAGNTLGWKSVPPGTRKSTYARPEYIAVSADFGPITLDTMNHVDPYHFTVQPVPYEGIAFVGIPEWVALGDTLSNLISQAIAGTISVSDALSQGQTAAQAVGNLYK